MLNMVELWVEYRWNYMKFHLYSTHNSTICKLLIINAVTYQRWKGGITNQKKYGSSQILVQRLIIECKKCIF